MNSSGFNNKGFTLVELLAVIALLSIVMSIVMYFAIDIVRTAKHKSYQVTVSNIESEATSYVLEQNKSFDWVDSDGGRIQYQCVTVQDLIDTGYFKGDVLDSNVDDNNKVKTSDYVYIERDANTKAVTKSIFNARDLCYKKEYVTEDPKINFDGEISFTIKQEGWQKKKDIVITYQLFTNDDYKNYKYDYFYIPSDRSAMIEFSEKNFAVADASEVLSVKVNGTLTAVIMNNDGDVLITETQQIAMIDNEPPVITCNASAAKVKAIVGDNSAILNRVTSCPSYISDCVKYFEQNECVAYIEPLYACGGSVTVWPSQVFKITDNSGVYISNRDDGTMKNEHGESISAFKHTQCNCDDGYCSWSWVMRATDEAGNEAIPKTFTYYVTYQNIVTRYNNKPTGCVEEMSVFNSYRDLYCPFN